VKIFFWFGEVWFSLSRDISLQKVLNQNIID